MKRVIRTFLIVAVFSAVSVAAYRFRQQQLGEELARGASTGDLTTVRLCIEAGADINRGPRQLEGGPGLPPLTVAASAGHTEVVRYLFDCGANPNRRGMGNPLFVACWRRHFDVAKLLLERGADPNIRGEGTPLCVAESTTQPALTTLLRAHGATK